MPAPMYDWETWFEQGEFRLRKGQEYFCGTASMCQMVRNAASQRGIRVTIEERDDREQTIEVRVLR